MASYPRDLATLLKNARKLAKSMEQHDVYMWIASVAKYYGLRVHCDEHPVDASPAAPVLPDDDAPPASPDDLSEEEPDRKSKKPTRIAVPMHRTRDGRTVMYLNDIVNLPIWESPSPGMAIGRVIISCERRAHRGGAPISSECNGVVIDARTWRPLVVPARAFSLYKRGLSVKIDEHIASKVYDIIHVDDGTIVTLYNWFNPTLGADEWCLATGNGYDVSTLKWSGPQTYAQIFFEVASLYPQFVASSGMQLIADKSTNDIKTRLTFPGLDKSRCYTVGFRSHDFHPMMSDPARMWQIQYTIFDAPDDKHGVDQVNAVNSNISSCGCDVKAAIWGKTTEDNIDIGAADAKVETAKEVDAGIGAADADVETAKEVDADIETTKEADVANVETTDADVETAGADVETTDETTDETVDAKITGDETDETVNAKITGDETDDGGVRNDDGTIENDIDGVIDEKEVSEKTTENIGENSTSSKNGNACAHKSGDCGYTVVYGSGLSGIPLQRMLTSADDQLTADKLVASCGGSLARAKAYIQTSKTPVPDGGVQPAELCYGYILRSRDPAVTGPNSDYLVESDLLIKVRQLVYDRLPDFVQTNITPETRVEYLTWRAFLNPAAQPIFEALFPERSGRYVKYREALNNIITSVVRKMRHLKLKMSVIGAADKTPTAVLARSFIDHIIHNEGGLNPFDKSTTSIVSDYVNAPDNAILYLRAYQCATSA